MLDVLCRGSREDDDIIENPHADNIQVFPEDVVHEELEHGRGVGGPLGAHLVFEMPLPAPECCFPFIPLLDPDLVIGVPQVNLGEDPGLVKAIQHFRYEGEGVTVFNSDFVEPLEVHNQPQLAIGPLDEHDGSSCRRLGGPDEAIGQVRLNILFHLNQFWGRHGVDGPPWWSRAGLKWDLQVILSVGRKDVGLRFREDIQVVMVFLGNFSVKGGIK